MNSADELALLKRHVRRIEADLSLALRQIADLERRMGTEHAAEAAPVAVTLSAPVPPPLPPPLPPARSAGAPAERPEGVLPPMAPAGAVAREFAPPAAVAPAAPSPLRAWLTSLQLWPPAGEENAEVRLAAWWATRIGAVLAVIGVVLFGVYVSVNTPPWVKFGELLAVSAAVAGAGLWWERSIPRFGAVVFSAGLALLYFCAFAGYALPAVKVIEGMAAAAMWQVAAIGILVAVAIVRRSSNIATMAVGFGLVTAIFSRVGGLTTYALCTSTLLGVAAVGFHRLFRWEAPSVVAMPGCYAVYALVTLGMPGRLGTADSLWVWGVLAGTNLLFFVRDWRVDPRDGAIPWGERWFQGVNSGLALLVGLGVALGHYREELAWFYLAAAFILVALASLRWRQHAGDPVGVILLTKAAGMLALAIVEIAEGRTAALALLIQAWVLLVSSRWLHSRTLWAASGVVATGAYASFLIAFRGEVAAASVDAAGMVLFVAGFGWYAAEAARRLSAGLERRMAEMVAGVGCFLAAWLAIHTWQPASWIAGWALLMATPLATVASFRRSWGAGLASGMLVVASHAFVWHLAMSTEDSPVLPGNALLVASVSIAAGCWLAGGGLAGLREVRDHRGRNAAAILWALSLVTIAVAAFEVCASPLAALVWILGLALALGAASPVFVGHRLSWLSVWTVAIALTMWAGRGVTADVRVEMFAAVVLAWALPFGLAASSRHRMCVQGERHGMLIAPLLVAAATVVTYRLLPWAVEPAWRLPLFAGTALAIGLAGAGVGLRAAIPASWMIWLMIGIATLGGLPSPDDLMQRVFAGLAAVAAWLPSIWFGKRGRSTIEPSWTSTHAVALQVTLAAVLGAWLALVGWRGAGQVLALLGVAALAWASHRFGGLSSARVATVLLLGAAWARAAALALLGGSEGWGAGFAAVVGVCVAVSVLPWLVGRTGPLVAEVEWRKLAWVAGSAGLALAYLLALVQRGGLAPYATVGWGMAAIILFVAGLFVRLRPYRLLGLAGLLVCIPRVFLVDLQSAFHRIIAFVVLGAVLLWVGFSYHRFRHLIVDTEEGS